MANLNRIIYLSEAQKEELFEEGSITVDEQTIVYNDNDLYLTDVNSYVASRLEHSLTFGSNQIFIFDGSEDVVVPTYTGTYTISE